MTLTYTKYYRFPKTDFMSEPWIQGIWDSFDAIDALMYNQAAANGTTVWLNATQYGPGRTVIDVTDGSTWICTTAHVSAAAPTSFAQDRQANPSFWTAIMLSIQARGQWLNNTAYNSGDMVYDTTAGRNVQAICVTKHVSNATGTINDDAAYWGFTYNSLGPTTAAGIGYSNATSHLVAVTVQAAIDEVVAVKAPIASPAFTGNPTAPTPAPGDNDTSIATTAFVQASTQAITSNAVPIMDGVATAGALQKLSRGDHVHPTDTSRAPLNSPAFTGTPTAPTVASVIDATTKLATTAFVQSAIIGITGGGSIPPPSNLPPLIDSTPAVVGVSPAYSREDHAHLSDTSRAAVTYVDSAIAGRAVRTDAPQSLTVAQRTQARQNIYAAPFDALAYNGIQVNGSMEVSQEFGTGGTQVLGGTSKHVVDGWRIQSNGVQVISAFQQVPAASYLTNSVLQATTPNPSPTSADFCAIQQVIEGYRISRLGWGGAGASPISIGFWVASTRTGMFSGSVRNADVTRSFPFSFTINTAGAWEYKTVTIPGDVTGTWAIDNSIGMTIAFALMSSATYTAPVGAWVAGNYLGVNGTANAIATTNGYMQITGVIVVPGVELPSSDRAPFIMRPYDQELLLCKRYFETWKLLAILRQRWVPASPIYKSTPAIRPMVSCFIILLKCGVRQGRLLRL